MPLVLAPSRAGALWSPDDALFDEALSFDCGMQSRYEVPIPQVKRSTARWADLSDSDDDACCKAESDSAAETSTPSPKDAKRWADYSDDEVDVPQKQSNVGAASSSTKIAGAQPASLRSEDVQEQEPSSDTLFQNARPQEEGTLLLSRGLTRAKPGSKTASGITDGIQLDLGSTSKTQTTKRLGQVIAIARNLPTKTGERKQS